MRHPRASRHRRRRPYSDREVYAHLVLVGRRRFFRRYPVAKNYSGINDLLRGATREAQRLGKPLHEYAKEYP